MFVSFWKFDAISSESIENNRQNVTRKSQRKSSRCKCYRCWVCKKKKKIIKIHVQFQWQFNLFWRPIWSRDNGKFLFPHSSISLSLSRFRLATLVELSKNLTSVARLMHKHNNVPLTYFLDEKYTITRKPAKNTIICCVRWKKCGKSEKTIGKCVRVVVNRPLKTAQSIQRTLNLKSFSLK